MDKLEKAITDLSISPISILGYAFNRNAPKNLSAVLNTNNIGCNDIVRWEWYMLMMITQTGKRYMCSTPFVSMENVKVDKNGKIYFDTASGNLLLLNNIIPCC